MFSIVYTDFPSRGKCDRAKHSTPESGKAAIFQPIKISVQLVAPSLTHEFFSRCITERRQRLRPVLGIGRWRAARPRNDPVDDPANFVQPRLRCPAADAGSFGKRFRRDPGNNGQLGFGGPERRSQTPGRNTVLVGYVPQEFRIAHGPRPTAISLYCILQYTLYDALWR